jgi:hypothetical protein
MSEIQLAIQDQYMAAFLEFIKTLPYIEIQQVNRTPVVLPPITPQKDRAWHLQVIAKGGNMAYIQDPMEWQRKIRKDRPLPFRED